MKKIFRGYGETKDKLTLQPRDRLPGMEGIVGANSIYCLWDSINCACAEV